MNYGQNKPPISARVSGPEYQYMNSHGDTWYTTWAGDNELYSVADDCFGFDESCNSNLAVHRLTGDNPYKLSGMTINPMSEYGRMCEVWEDGAVWKATGLTCIDNVLYLAIGRHRSIDTPKGWRQFAMNASIIKSSDHGLTWLRTARENYEKPMFPGQRFGAPFFIEYGKNGTGTAHGADKYVYAISNDGFWNNGNTMILARCPREKMSDLNGADWKYYIGNSADGLVDKNWGDKMLCATHILRSPDRLSMSSVQYVTPINRYVMITWYYTDLIPYDTQGMTVSQWATTTWEFYESPAPWGPWSKFGVQSFHPQGYYNPVIVSKFIQENGRDVVVFTNGSYMTAGKQGNECIYRLTVMPISFQTGY